MTNETVGDMFDAIAIEKDREHYFKEKSNYENMICVKPEEHPYINEEPLIDIPADRTYFKILDYEIRGHGDLEEFLKDLNECKDAQHRWNELRDWLDDRINCVVSVDGVLMKMNELEKEDDDGR